MQKPPDTMLEAGDKPAGCDEKPQAESIEEAIITTAEELPLMDLDNGLVGWESASDPMNARNWTSFRKAYVMILISIISTLSPLASSMVAPGTSIMLKDLNESSLVIGSFTVSVYILGYAIGPLFLGPMSELYGRYPVVILATWFFCIWVMGSALAPNMPSLIVMRLLAGIGGSAVMTISPAIVADLYPIETRGFWTSIVVLAQSVGPALGPICGGFISEALGWRWAYWILFIPAAATNLLMSFFMPESYAPRILFKKAERLRKETGRPDLHPLMNSKLPPKQLLATAIVRPVKLLTRSLIAISICTYVATIYGILYIWLTTIPDVFRETYGWPTSLTGLAYTPIGLGMVLGLMILMKTNDSSVMKLTKKNNMVYEPEFRLPHCVYYAALVPISLFWYGWSTQLKAHWAVPIVGMLPFGFGMIGIFMPCQTYLVDAFSVYAASAVSASRVMLSILGAFLPLAGPPLYKSLGFGVGNTVLGIVALLMVPIPVILYKFGKRIRQRYPITL